MKLTRIVPVLIFAALASDYCHGCDLERMTECGKKFLAIIGSTRFEDYAKVICRSDVLTYTRCINEEGLACGNLNQYLPSLKGIGYSSMADVEKHCASNGLPISDNAAKQILPTAVIIVGILMALFVQTFPF